MFFDFLPLAVEDVRGYKTRFHLYTIPGQTFYEISREFILKGVDGIVFVVDSQEDRMDANIESFEALERSLDRQGYDLPKIPLVFQYNKRDMPKAWSRFRSWKRLSIQGDGRISRPLQIVARVSWRRFKPSAKL